MKILKLILAALLCVTYSCQLPNSCSPKRLNRYKVFENKLLKNGVWIEIDTLSNQTVVRYNKGIKEGKELIIDSVFYRLGNYKNGLKNGWFRYYIKDGTLVWKYFYKDDIIIKSKIFRTFSPKMDM